MVSMKKNASFVEYIVYDIFSSIPNISAKAMFGGYGVYRDGVMFGIIADGELYLKVSETQKEKYVSFGGRAFTYMKKDIPHTLSYYAVPESVLENSSLIKYLAEDAYEYALECSVKKKAKK